MDVDNNIACSGECPGCGEDLNSEIMYLVKYTYSSETDVCFPVKGESLEVGCSVVVPSRYGNDMGVVLGQIKCPHLAEGEQPLRILRRASAEDLIKLSENQIKEKKAFKICKDKIELHKLEMKLIDVHYLLDEPKGLFFFSAESRVDFRELVKDLVSIFKMRIELRQIGVRDESRVLGGMGVCGRIYCCHGITDKLRPVSIKMAKEQNLSLNSMKISGPCGRLLCCLSYEYDLYHTEKRKLPSEGSRLLVGKNLFRVQDVNILTKKISIHSDEGRTIYAGFDKLTYHEDSKNWSLPVSILEND